MPCRYTKQVFAQRFYRALDIFNAKMGSNICKGLVHLDFFTPQNGVEVYERFCQEHFPKYLSEMYKTDGYFDDMGGQAFLNENEYGVLIREDIDYPEDELFRMLFHEISHLFCARNEIPNGDFFTKYCLIPGDDGEVRYVGYAIWRETVADIMADSIMYESSTISLKNKFIRNRIVSLYHDVLGNDSESRKAMSLIIAYVMRSKQVDRAEAWSEARKAILQNVQIDDTMLLYTLETVFHQLRIHPYWRITPDFIVALGDNYFSLVLHKQLHDSLTDALLEE